MYVSLSQIFERLPYGIHVMLISNFKLILSIFYDISQLLQKRWKVTSFVKVCLKMRSQEFDQFDQQARAGHPTGSRLRVNQAGGLMNRDSRDLEGNLQKIRSNIRSWKPPVGWSCPSPTIGSSLLFATFPFLKRQLLHFTESWILMVFKFRLQLALCNM